MERRMVEERERACDEAVVAMGNRPGVYAESLLKAVRFCVESPLVCVAGITGADLAARVRSIMRPRLEKLSLWRKVALGALAAAAIAGPVGFGRVRMIPMYGQIADATGPLPSFEVATIKPSNPEARGKGYRTDGRHFSTLNTTASDLLQYAYGIQSRQIVGAPAWLDVNKYEILAVAGVSDSNDPKWNLMMRRLLADRFGLTFHRETKELPVYELRIGKNGPKLAKSGADPDHGELYFSRTTKTSSGMSLHAKAATMTGLASLLQVGLLERPVVDRTGLAGTFDFELDFTSDRTKGGNDAPPLSEDPDAAAGIFTAIQEQLGLKLVAAKGPGEVIVIDHIERPMFDEAEVKKPSPQTRTANPVSPAAVRASLVQERPAAAKMEFEAASIRLANPASRSGLVVNFIPSGGLRVVNATLRDLIETAYNIRAFQVEGGPSWTGAAKYDVTATSGPPPDSAGVDKHDNEVRLRVEALLKDRFHLEVHPETRDVAVYSLVVAKNGVRTDGLRATNNPIRGVNAGSGTMLGEAAPMTALALKLSYQVGRIVVNNTGLEGNYDFKLQWAPDTASPAADGRSGDDSSGPSLFTALQEQLGLKLEPAKGPVETLVIDHVERPSEN
jgi:uncharacterized protein (TIGR03435 family)